MKKIVLSSFFLVTAVCYCTSLTRADGSSGWVAQTAENETIVAQFSNEKLATEPPVEAEEADELSLEEEDFFDDELEPIEDGEFATINDPLESYNRAIFVFNDKFYYYAFKPVYTGYKKVVPEKARISVKKFFSNIKTPIRLFNCLFQGKFNEAGTEGLRFLINSTYGVAGFFDPATSQFHLEKYEEDTGQTLAVHKVKSGVYLNWPLIGPSTVRGTFGYIGDIVLNPITIVTYLFLNPIEGFGITAYNTVNDGSIDAEEVYEGITKPAIDPYVALRDAYIQNRKKKIEE